MPTLIPTVSKHINYPHCTFLVETQRCKAYHDGELETSRPSYILRSLQRRPCLVRYHPQWISSA
jgi:hypothetical protein